MPPVAASRVDVKEAGVLPELEVATTFELSDSGRRMLEKGDELNRSARVNR
jgi:hypothetical protein